MTLQFLDFDTSEDAHGVICWDALASPRPIHNPGLLAEVAHLLSRLSELHGSPGPLDDGHLWDCDLQAHDIKHQSLPWHWHGHQLQWQLSTQEALSNSITLSLTLTGSTEMAHTLALEFGNE
ncbi:hypothetical protein B9Z51_01310 [Limnohabitans sp. T6-5]|uniref:hypothetical protein n=1 Tax=Limnohabitans sp. T6-5 TaxID=1100724 RepID=UPI000D382ED0|nr:hypothetical protein [Limnohabitans sp. T6-5]PUE11004.1 hypothetical protein B9Z51_01310 [Limnohabitans sp. T6-5]